MKKAIKYIALALVLIPCALLLAACSTNVAGKTFVYSDHEITWAEGTPDEFKEEMNEQVVEMYKTMVATFNKDGSGVMKMTMDSEEIEQEFYYTQDGETIKIYEDKELKNEVSEFGTFTAKNGKVTISSETDNIGSIKITFKKK